VDHLGREIGEPAGQRRTLVAAPELVLEVSLDEIGRPVAVARGQRMADRVVGEPVALVPVGRCAVQRRWPRRVVAR
jgi:hypothetical protein